MQSELAAHVSPQVHTQSTEFTFVRTSRTITKHVKITPCAHQLGLYVALKVSEYGPFLLSTGLLH